MNNNKQSSIGWLVSELTNLGYIFAPSFGHKIIDEKIKQAKAMHKEEMKQTYFDGWHRNIGNRDEDFENYYNKTQGGNNEQQ